MFCDQCGSPLADTAQFCGKCGNKIQRNQTNSEPVNQTVNREKPVSGISGKEKIGEMLKDVNLQKTADDVKKTGSTIISRIRQWAGDYLETWREWSTLQRKEQYIWFGIHGGVLLVLLCIIIVPIVRGMGDSGGTLHNIARTIDKMAKDGEFSGEDISLLAQGVRDYADIKAISDAVSEMIRDGRDEEYGFENINDVLFLSDHVAEECIGLSGYAPVSEYNQWYDEDGLADMIFGHENTEEYITLHAGDLRFTDSGRGEEGTSTVRWYVYGDSDKITFVKTTTFGGDREAVEDIYEGIYQVSGTELVITMNETDYHLAEADTDIAEKWANAFGSMAKGYWKCPGDFYSVIRSALGIEESKGAGSSRFIYVMDYAHIEIVDENGGILSNLSFEQGDGNTAILSRNGNTVQISYSVQGDVLTLTINGVNYSLARAHMRILDMEKYTWGIKGGAIIE